MWIYKKNCLIESIWLNCVDKNIAKHLFRIENISLTSLCQTEGSRLEPQDPILKSLLGSWTHTYYVARLQMSYHCVSYTEFTLTFEDIS